MSSFGKPHSYVSPHSSRQESRPRQYPYILNKSRSVWHVRECEACEKTIEHTIRYYPDKNAMEASVVELCNDHEKLTRYGKWDQVFKDIDRKCDKGIK